VPLAERDHVIRALPPDAPDRPLDERVLPRAPLGAADDEGMTCEERELRRVTQAEHGQAAVAGDDADGENAADPLWTRWTVWTSAFDLGPGVRGGQAAARSGATLAPRAPMR